MKRFFVDARWRLKEFLRSAGPAIVFFLLALLLGTVLGSIAGINIVGTVESEDITDYTVDWYLGVRISFGAYFGRGLLDVLCCFFLILFCNWTIVLIFGNYLLLIVKGYVIGFNLFVIIGSLGVGGFFQILFILLPQQLLLLTVLVYASVCASQRCLRNRGCGLWCFRGVEYNFLIKKMFAAFFVYLILNLFFSLISSVVMSGIVLG